MKDYLNRYHEHLLKIDKEYAENYKNRKKEEDKSNFKLLPTGDTLIKNKDGEWCAFCGPVSFLF